MALIERMAFRKAEGFYHAFDPAVVGEEELGCIVWGLRNILLHFDCRKNGRRASPGLTNFSQKLPLKRSVIETMFELSRRIFLRKIR